MASDALMYIGIGLTTLGMAGTAIGVSRVFCQVIDSVSRNPSTEKLLSKYAYVGAALTEAMGLFSLLLALLALYG